MLRVTLSGSLNFQIGAFTVLVVLIHSCRGQHHVNCPSQPILATVGEDIILPAYLEPAINALRKTIEWTRPDLSPRYVHVQRQGVKLTDNHPSYEGRTSLLSDELKLGNISLKLSRVRISDEGPYRCFIPEMKISCIIQLVVGAASSPDVQMTVVLQCNSTGWYPEPEVFWLDGEGNLLSAGPTETVRGPDDLYTVSSRVTVEKRHSNSFTCRVQQNHTNQTREAHIHVPDDFFPVQSSSSSTTAGLVVSLAVCILVILILGFYVWRQEKTRTKRIHRDETGEGEMNQEGEGLVTKSKLNEQQQELKEEQQKLKEEQQKLNEQQQRLKEEQQSREEAENRVQILEEELQKKNREEEKKKRQEEVQRKNQELQEKTDQMERNKDEANMKLLQETKNKEKAQSEVKMLKDQLESKNKEVDGLKVKINKLTEEKKRSEEERQQLQTNKEQLEQKLNDEKKLGSSLSSQVVSLTAEVNQLTEEKKRSEEERQKLQTKITEMEKQLQDQQQKAAGAQREWERKFNEEKKEREKELQEEKKKREEEVQGKNQELQEKTDQVDGLKDEVKKLTEEKKKSEAEKQQLQTNKEQPGGVQGES